MASKQRVLNVVIRNWRPVVNHLENVAARGSAESAVANELLKVIISYKWVSYLHFLTDLVDILTLLSLKLQTDNLTGNMLSVALDTTKMQLHNFKHRPVNIVLNSLETVWMENGRKYNFKIHDQLIRMISAVYLKVRFIILKKAFKEMM